MMNVRKILDATLALSAERNLLNRCLVESAEGSDHHWTKVQRPPSPSSLG